MTKQFKKDETVWVKSMKVKGKVRAILSNDQYKVEVITAFNKERGERTTKLPTVSAKDLAVYREPKNKRTHQPLKIQVKYFSDIEPLAKIQIGDWIDLRASEDIILNQFEDKMIPLGIGMKLPVGYEANIVPRSSTYKHFKIIQTNSFGVVDNSYSGNDDQWHFPALAIQDTYIKKGDRICQFRINKVMSPLEIETVEFLGEVSRGGFGTTGVK